MRIVYFSPVPWDSFTQRPHEFIDWFLAKFNGQALWVDPYPTRLPVLSDFNRIKSLGTNTLKPAEKRTVPDGLTICRPKAFPVEPILGAGFLNKLIWKDVFRVIDTFIGMGECRIGIGKPSELALQVLIRYPSIASFYDAMDDFPAFYEGLSKAAIQRRENSIAAKVGQLSVSSTCLANRFSTFSTKQLLILNGCSIDRLPMPNPAAKSKDKPILGYVGTIGHWFDWRLVFSLAEANPSMCVRLIGPVYQGAPENMPHNIELLPACDHKTAVVLMQEFSVGLIPFKLNELTASVDPIKYYEYRSLGLPVLSTRFGEMATRNEHIGVFFIDQNADLANQVDCAISYEPELSEILEFRKANSWTARFEILDFNVVAHD